jgi:signal transduction histidine kinase/CheY-like chemotaxis protein
VKRFLVSRFAILCFLCVSSLAFVMGAALSTLLTRAVSDWEWENTAALARREVERAGLDAFLVGSPDEATRERWGREFSRLFSTLPEVVRVKVWDRQATVIWSDESHLIGQRFPDNEELQAALRGKVAVEIKTLTKREHAYERSAFALLAEVYVPLFSKDDGRVLGVLEVYKTPQRLEATIRWGRFVIWTISIVGGLALYAILVPLVSQVYRREVQEQTLREYAETLEQEVAARTEELQSKSQEAKDAYQELSRTQAQLIQAQKMDAVGRLAGGVAHDFNNLLTVIIGQTALLADRLGRHHPLRQGLDIVEDAARRASDLTGQLLAFSRRQVLQPEVLDLNRVVAGMERMLGRLIGEDIELVTTLQPALGAVRADPGQLGQVILNLAVNARDAMPNGGRLALATAEVELDDVSARRYPGGQPGRYVRLSVTDTGHGMDAETQAHLFEPFFTTKRPDKGTGLGLATVYGIVKQSGGNIWVSSTPGRGTTFEIYLPRAEAAIERREGAVSTPDARQASETILLVEDEDAVRAIIAEVLQESGYSVLEARHGGEALSVSERHVGLIQLLLTDMVMPGMTGRELAQRLTANRPGIKVLYMSGYTDDAGVAGTTERGTGFLQKPFTPETLSRKVRELLRS